MARHKYRIYGLVVESELALTSVEPCDETLPADISIVFGVPAEFERRAAGLRHDAEDVVRYLPLDDGGLYIRIAQAFEAIVEPNGRRVVCARLEGFDERTFEANLANYALSASLTLQGEECLHATVVALGDRAVGLIGPSGDGKSTLAGCLLGRGAALVTDDMLRLVFKGERLLAQPGPYRLKLFEDSARQVLEGALNDGNLNRLSRKMMFRLDERRVRRATRAVPLAALFWLGEPSPPGSEEVSVASLTGIAPVKALTHASMNGRYYAPERLERQLRFAERVARQVPVFALQYRRDYALLDKVADALERVVGA